MESVLSQRLLRHSSPHLTANVYTKLDLHDAAATVAKIDFGNDDVPLCRKSCRTVGHEGGSSARFDVREDPHAEGNGATQTFVAQEDEDGACSGTRTPNLRIKSPLLYQLS